MSRNPDNPNTSTPRNRLGSLPYSSHPLYKLRKITLWAILLGILLHIISLPVGGQMVLWAILFYIISAVFVIADLVRYSTEKLQREVKITRRRAEYESLRDPRHRDQDEDNHSRYGIDNLLDDDGDDEKKPRWPIRRLLGGDLVLSSLWFCIFVLSWVPLASQPYYHYNMGEIVLYGYATLIGLVMSILHGIAFWKELKACLEKKWRKKLVKKLRCGRCGERFGSDARLVEEGLNVNREGARGGIGGDIANTGPSLPRWMTHGPQFGSKTPVARQSNLRGSRDSNIDRDMVDVEATASSDDSSTSLLIAPTPEESSAASTVKGYGTLSDSCASLNVEAEKLVRKKSFKRVVGLDGSEQKGKEKRVDDGNNGVEY